MVWPALIAGGASILSSFLGSRSSGPTTTTTNFVKLRKNAEKAGINVLAALRAGAAAGFQTVHTPALASSTRIARALTSGINTFFQTGIDQAEAQGRAELLKAQLDLVKEQTNRVKSSPMLGGVPRAHGTAVAGPSTAAALTGRRPEPNIGPSAPPGVNPVGARIDDVFERLMPRTITPVAPGYNYDVPAGTPGGQVLEDVAEPLAEIEGARRVGEFAKQNPTYFEKLVRDIGAGAIASTTPTSPAFLPLRILNQIGRW